MRGGKKVVIEPHRLEGLLNLFFFMVFTNVQGSGLIVKFPLLPFC